MRRVLARAHAALIAIAASMLALVTGPSTLTAQAAAPSLTDLATAVASVDYTAVQLRRFAGTGGAVVTAREMVEVKANGSSRPNFRMTFLGVEGELPGSPLSLDWQQTYARFGAQFFTHGTFKVRDLLAAANNYTVFDFGAVTRIGRAARRIVVFPSRIDKAMWVVDVDVQTNVPLYTAEFDAHLTVLAEVEAVSFTIGVASLPSGPTSTLHPDFAAARTAMGNPAELVEPTLGQAAEYSIEAVEVQVDHLNGRNRLVMTYTDGIDQFVVVQTPGTPDYLRGLPSNTRGGRSIARYRDPAMSVLLFWESGVSFHVAGRGAMLRLDNFARSLLLQAIATH